MLVYDETHADKELREKYGANDEPDAPTADNEDEEEPATKKEEEEKAARELLKMVAFRKKFQSNLVKLGLEIERVGLSWSF
jgi:hypothetical protein